MNNAEKILHNRHGRQRLSDMQKTQKTLYEIEHRNRWYRFKRKYRMIRDMIIEFVSHTEIHQPLIYSLILYIMFREFMRKRSGFSRS